jgi:catecholate siderophore receptor
MKMFRMTPLAAAVVAVYAVPGLAQEAEAPAAAPTETPAPAKQKEVALPAVKVQDNEDSPYKAEVASPKYTAPLRDTPKQVTVISSQIMQDNVATSLQDALRTVPGITFMAGEGGTAIADRPVIRGLSSSNSIFIDGIRDIGTQTRDVFSLESVEVSKGADSAFGGRGSGGGSINLVTKQAHEGNDGAANLTMGTSDMLRGTVDKNWQINDTTAARLNVLGTRGNTPGRDDAVDYDKWGAAGSLAFGLGTPTRITADYYHLTDNGMPDYSIPYDLADGRPVTETMDVDSKNFYGLLNRDFRHTTTDTGTISIAHDLDGGMLLRNVTRYGESLNSYVVSNPDDSSGNVAKGLVYRSSKQRYAQTDTFANTTDLTGKFKTGFIDHSFDLGAEYSREMRNQDSWLVTPANPPLTAAGVASRDCTLAPKTAPTYDCTSLGNPNPDDPWAGTVTRAHAPTHFTTETQGVYAFDTLTLAPQWLVNVGVRWDSYDTKAERESGVNSAGTAVPALSASNEDDFINYQGGLIFKPAEEGSIYVSYSTETTPQATGSGDEDAITTVLSDYRPIESRSAEIGAKWEFFERVLVSGAVFDTKRKHDCITGSSSNVCQPVGETRIKGAELSISGNITRNWQMFGGYSYLDSELSKGNLFITQPAGGHAEILDPAQGKVLPNTPKNSLSLFTNYRFLEKATIGGGAYYVSKVYGSTQTSSSTTAAGITTLTIPKYVPDYWRFDAMAGYDFTPSLTAQLNVQNLTDETYYTKAFTTHYAQLGPGRQYLLSLNMKF